MYNKKVINSLHALLDAISTAIDTDGSSCNKHMAIYSAIEGALKVPDYVTLPHDMLSYIRSTLDKELGANTGGSVLRGNEFDPHGAGQFPVNPQATSFSSPYGWGNNNPRNPHNNQYNPYFSSYDTLPELDIIVKAKEMGSGNFGGVPDITFKVYHPRLEVGCLLNDAIELCHEILGHNQVEGVFSTFAISDSPFTKIASILSQLASKDITFELNGSVIR